MLSSLVSVVRSSSLPVSKRTGSQAKRVGVRGYRKSAILRNEGSGGAGGRKPFGGAGSGMGKDGTEGGVAKKESFDDFFESLMKGQGQASNPSGSASGQGGVNVASIMSSLNKSVSAEEEEVVDSRLSSLFQKRSTSSAISESSLKQQKKDHDAAIEALEDDSDFVEFLAAMKKDYKASADASSAASSSASASPSSGPGGQFPFALPKFKVNIPDEVPDVRQMSPEQAKAHFMEQLKKENPDLAKMDKWRGAIISRSEMEHDMSQTSSMERRELNEATLDIYQGNDLPAYVTSVRIPNPETGESTNVDLLNEYDQPGVADEMANILATDAQKAGVDPAHWEEVLSSGRFSSASKLAASQEDSELLSHPVISQMFKALSDEGKRIDEMQYWSLFPKAVKRWVLYTRTPKGFYNDQGEWESSPELDLDEVLATEDAEMKAAGEPSIMEGPVTTAELDELAAISPSLRNPDAARTNVEEDDPFARITNSEWAYWDGIYQNEQRYLPADLRGQFRFHIRPEEINHMHPRLRRHFSFKFASEGEITKFRTSEAIRKWGRHPGDSGNSAVQIAVLTLRINHLTKVLRTNSGDAHNGYRLNELIRRRKGLMKHLKKRDLMTYYSLLQDIKLRDQVELWTAARK